MNRERGTNEPVEFTQSRAIWYFIVPLAIVGSFSIAYFGLWKHFALAVVIGVVIRQFVVMDAKERRKA